MVPNALNVIVDKGTLAGQQSALIVVGEADQAWWETVDPSCGIHTKWGRNANRRL